MGARGTLDAAQIGAIGNIFDGTARSLFEVSYPAWRRALTALAALVFSSSESRDVKRSGCSSSQWLVFGSIDATFQPHGIQNREHHGEAKAQNPGKVPHTTLLIGGFRIFGDIAAAYRTAQHVVDPGRIGDDDRQKDHDGAQHDAERELA